MPVSSASRAPVSSPRPSFQQRGSEAGFARRRHRMPSQIRVRRSWRRGGPAGGAKPLPRSERSERPWLVGARRVNVRAMARTHFTVGEVEALIPTLEEIFLHVLQLRAGLRAVEEKLDRA